MFLKPSLPEDAHVTLTMSARNGQDASGQYGPKFKYDFLWDGKMYQHDATLTEEKVLQKVNPGDKVQAKKTKNKFGTMSIFWERLSGAAIPQNTNSTNIPAPRNPSPSSPSTQSAPQESEKSIEIGLRGIVQALVSGDLSGRGNMDKYEYKMLIEQAMDAAEKTHHLFAEAAHRLATNKANEPHVNEAYENDTSYLPF